MNSNIGQQIQELINTALMGSNCVLWGLKLITSNNKHVLHIFIDTVDKSQGITLGDCEQSSRLIAAQLDVADIIENKYLLEVSSPGFNRQLFTANHFVQYKDNAVIIKLYQAVANRKHITGTLLDCKNNTIVVEYVNHKKQTTEAVIGLDNIKSAKLNNSWQ